MNHINLILNHSEFDESFSENERWQKKAEKSLIDHLLMFGNDAKKFSNIKKDEVQHVHNAILISGDRGTGKTVFLKNTKSIWENYKEDKPNLHFTPIIDPTLLQNNDNFTTVIIAHIYNEINNKLNGCQCDNNIEEDQKQKFYDKLRYLAEAIEQHNEKSSYSGIDKIIHYSSGIKIDSLFSDFAHSAINILKCDAIVLLIDDVDMALNQAYTVLEEIRRRLSSPYIIPIISGDLDLYQRLVKINISLNLHTKDEKNNNDKAQALTYAYLTKVLPNQYRINLQSINELLHYIKIKKYNDDSGISFEYYKELLIKHFFGKINPNEKSTNFPWPISAREINQLVRILPPCQLIKEKYIDNLAKLSTLAESKQHGATYILAQTMLQLEHKDLALLRNLFAFNVKKQAELKLSWARYDFIDDQKNLATIFDNSSHNNNNFLNLSFSHFILRSMPPVEMFTDKLSITENNAKQEKDYLLAYYTYNTYYGNQGFQQRKIYFSRAFEILSISLLSPSINTHSYTTCIYLLLNTHPFYSILALNPTKTINEENSEEDSEEDNENISEKDDPIINEIIIIANIINHHVDWQNKYNAIINKFKENTNIIALLSAVFNKTFSQLHLLRVNYHKKKLEDDNLTDAIFRFKYILLNNFGYFLNFDGDSVSANLALSTPVMTLRDELKFKNSSPTYKKNMAWVDDIIKQNENNHLSEEENKENIKLIAAKFIDAIAHHPIFKIENNNKSAKITDSSGTIKKEEAAKKTSRKKTLKQLTTINNLRNDQKYPSLIRLIEDLEKNIVDIDSVSRIYKLCKNEMNKKNININELSKSYQIIYSLLEKNSHHE